MPSGMAPALTTTKGLLLRLLISYIGRRHKLDRLHHLLERMGAAHQPQVPARFFELVVLNSFDEGFQCHSLT